MSWTDVEVTQALLERANLGTAGSEQVASRFGYLEQKAAMIG